MASAHRDTFVKHVMTLVSDDLKHNGFTLETVTISSLDQASASALASVAVGRNAAGIGEVRLDAERAIGREEGEAGEPFSAFAPVKSHKSRHECVLLPFEALKDALS